MLLEADLVWRDRQTDGHTDQLLRPPFAYVPRGYKYGFFGVTEIGMHIIYIDMCRLCVIAMVCAYRVRCNVVELHCFSEFP